MELHGAAQALLVLSVAAALGLGLGQIQVAGVRLGVGGVLFAGIGLGHLGLTIDATMMSFAREFGLVLFVYAIGVSVGPGFFQAFKKDGMALNLMAASVVLLGTLVAAGLHLFAGLPLPAALGVLAGAVTNTPSLAAGQEVMGQLGAQGASIVLGQAYAVAYPFGIVGILLTMLGLRFIFGIDPKAASAAFLAAREAAHPTVMTINIEIANPAVFGCRVRDLDELRELGVVLSRVLHDGSQHIVHADDILAKGDVVLAVGPKSRLGRLTRLLGPVATIDLKTMESHDVVWERMVVTRSEVLGKSLGELDFRGSHGMVVSRVNRAGHDLVPDAHLRLQFADALTVVGEPSGMAAMSKILGNRAKALQETQMVPIFVGIALGMVLGSVPIMLPGLPSAVKLGLAGGPLLVAILLSRLGHFGPVVWFMTPAANHVMRDLGITLFLAAVGVKAGGGFVDTLVHGPGLTWLMWGAAVTLVPLATVALVGHLWLKTNYLTLCGLLAGSMTDPPALAFAQGLASSEAAILSYATVYPLVMVLRIVAPQVVALALWM
ncbi:putative transport protein AHA_3492 [Magnetospirillum sp. LM-5]|uniref:putative transporter n=1 Tax=Magnetospirillum sp. LM-5 TaxID=2681466 RepID=UPI001381DBDA|nr:putative transporter [Magnetospirillum sp. LM-5]CAA7615344.1 putative transport protein AHA_3492 [Magnetospirillum sp. LM-5]